MVVGWRHCGRQRYRHYRLLCTGGVSSPSHRQNTSLDPQRWGGTGYGGRSSAVDTVSLHSLSDCYTSSGIERHTISTPVPWLWSLHSRLSKVALALGCTPHHQPSGGELSALAAGLFTTMVQHLRFPGLRTLGSRACGQQSVVLFVVKNCLSSGDHVQQLLPVTSSKSGTAAAVHATVIAATVVNTTNTATKKYLTKGTLH